MIKNLLIAFLILTGLAAKAQNKMQAVNELINNTDPGWPIVKEWIESAKNKVEVLTADSAKAKDALFKIQVTTRSPMGSVVYMTGGILVDDGWIRILGSGNPMLNRSLPDWNKGKSLVKFGEASPFLLIADDAVGGFYLLNGGGLGKDLGKVYYFSPENLTYEPLGITYSNFLQFCFNSNLDKFYKGLRWTNWKNEVSKLAGDKVFSFYPYLWTREGKNIKKNTRNIVPIEEQYNLNCDMRKQLGLDK